MTRRLEPFECEIHALGPRGTGIGLAPDGRPVEVRGGLPGSRVAVVPAGRKNGVWAARRTALLSRPPGYVVPPCPIFGLCGGCSLQELELSVQRAHKHERAVRDIAPPDSANVHPPRGGSRAYGYRNKLELTFGTRRYLDDASHAAGVPIEGRFLGFHAPGRFDRIADAARCLLGSDRMNELIAAVRATALAPGAPPPWDPRSHVGFWRHLVLREAAGGRLAVLVTAPPADPEQAAAVERVARALITSGAAGVAWWVNDGVAGVARGRTERTWGAETVDETIGHVTLSVSAASFLQTSSEGAVVLYDTVAEGVGKGRILVDLYSGIGAIGLYLADRFDTIVGVEEVGEAVADARRNAARAGISARFVHAKVEDALDELDAGPDVQVVVDPPRAGLHPRVLDRLASLPVASLVYVACHPPSLGRDARGLAGGGWRMTDLYTVDLFPQTGHLEAVARFVR